MSAPPMPYFGGKITLAPQIVSLFPPHEHYVEPYCGSLAVLLAKPPSRMETVNDLDGELMTFWRVLRDQPHELARACALTPHSRAEHRRAYDRNGCDDLERARRLWVTLTQSRSASTISTAGWRNPVAPDGGSIMPDYLAGYVRRIPAAAERLRRVSLECRPAVDVIATYGRDPQVLLYVDPPYLGSTRSKQSSNYTQEMREPEQHRELAEALLRCRASVVLSGYPSALYQELYADWYRCELPAGTGQGGAWANRTEILWSNRPIRSQPALFDGEAS